MEDMYVTFYVHHSVQELVDTVELLRANADERFADLCVKLEYVLTHLVLRQEWLQFLVRDAPVEHHSEHHRHCWDPFSHGTCLYVLPLCRLHCIRMSRCGSILKQRSIVFCPLRLRLSGGLPISSRPIWRRELHTSSIPPGTACHVNGAACVGAMSLTVLRVCMCWFTVCSETRAQVKAALDAGDTDRRAFAAFARTVYSQLEIEQLPAFRQSPQFQRVMSETVQHCRSVRILFLRWLHPYLTLDAYGLCDMYGVLQPAPPDVLEGDERWRNLTLAFPGRTKTNMGINPRFPLPYHSS